MEIENSRAENRILCTTQFSFRAFIAEIENISSKIQNGKSKYENVKSILMRRFYCNIGKLKYANCE